MALEVLGGAIRITRGDDTPIEAIIKDSTGTAITTGEMKMVIPEAKIDVNGTYANNKWTFVLHKCDLRGRYFYHFEHNGLYLDFKAPIYFE